jgi:glycosyltransferase involved in cell wall biosynthesis
VTGPGDGVPLVVHVIPTATARGGQREARALATRLDVPGVRRHLVLSLFAGPDEVPVDEAIGHPGGDRPAVGFDPRLVWRVRAVLERLDPTVVVAHGGDPLKYLVLAMIGARRPLAYYATGTFEHAGRAGRVALWRALVGRADVVAAEGDEVLEQCRALLHVPPERSVLAPNGRDPEEFHPPERPVGRPQPVLVFVGALTPGKRPERFVEVVAELRRAGVGLRALLCGDGPMAPALARPAADAGVEMLGTRSDVAEVLRGADVFVFPSRPTGEGMPGVRAIVDDGVSGTVVGVDDLDAMVGATGALVADPARRRAMGDAARRRCVERFSLDSVAACWLAFLTPLVERGVRGRRARNGPGTRRARGG